MPRHPFVPAEVEAALGDRFVIASEIGVGGQGVVFRATRVARPDGTATQDDVALKLHLYPCQDVRVKREISTLEHISHPSLARLIEHGFIDVADRHTRYIAYEFIEGQSLRHRLKSGRLLEYEALAIARDVSAAIAAIWAERIVHGDIKPSNIMLRQPSGDLMLGSVDSAVLIDLGAAGYFEQNAAPRSFRPLPEVGSDNRPWGTVGYLSPEQINGEKLSCASDIFSLGIVLLECLQGWHPTKHDQRALSAGIKASGRRLSVSPGFLSALDRMLIVRPPRARGKLAPMSSYFESLRQRTEEAFASGAPAPQESEV